jgi:hypothetical protein
MSTVIVTADVKDGKQWAERFPTHLDIFKQYTIKKPVRFAVEGNHVTICFEPENLDSYLKSMKSDATAKAMANDGVKRETVKIVPLDKSVAI